MAIITSAQSGLWSSTSTWSGGVLPANNDSVVIAATHQVEFDVNLSSFTNGIKGITIQNGAKLFCTRTQNSSLSVSSITRSGSTATVTCNGHGLINGDTVYISGSTVYGYNGKYTITYIDANTFSFTCDSSLTTPATGTIVCRKHKQLYLKLGSSTDTDVVDIIGTNTSGHLGTFEAVLDDRPDIEFVIDLTGTATITQTRRFYGGATYKTLQLNLVCYENTPYYVRSDALVTSGSSITFSSTNISNWNVGDSVFVCDPVTAKSGRGVWNGQGAYSIEEMIISTKSDTSLTFTTNFANGLGTGKRAGTFLINLNRNIRILNYGGGTPSGYVTATLFENLANNAIIRAECKPHNYTSLAGNWISNCIGVTIGGVFSTYYGQNPRVSGNLFGVRNNVYNAKFDKLTLTYGNGNWYYGLNMVANTITDTIFAGCTGMISGVQNNFTNCVFTCNTNIISSSCGGVVFDNCLFSGHQRFGFSLGAGNPNVYAVTDGIVMSNCTIEYFGYGLGQAALGAKLLNCTLSNNTRDISQATGRIELYNCTFTNTTTQWEAGASITPVDKPYALTQAYDINGVEGNFKSWSAGGIISTDSTVVLESVPSLKWNLSSSTQYCIFEMCWMCAGNAETVIEILMQQSTTGMTERLKCDIFLPQEDPWVKTTSTTLMTFQIDENTNKQKKVFTYMPTSSKHVMVRLYAKNASGNIWTTILTTTKTQQDSILTKRAYTRI